MCRIWDGVTPSSRAARRSIPGAGFASGPSAERMMASKNPAGPSRRSSPRADSGGSYRMFDTTAIRRPRRRRRARARWIPGCHCRFAEARAKAMEWPTRCGSGRTRTSRSSSSACSASETEWPFASRSLAHSSIARTARSEGRGGSPRASSGSTHAPRRARSYRRGPARLNAINVNQRSRVTARGPGGAGGRVNGARLRTSDDAGGVPARRGRRCARRSLGAAEPPARRGTAGPSGDRSRRSARPPADSRAIG